MGVCAPRPNCDYLWPGARNPKIPRDLTIGSRNEGHSQIQGVLEHRLVVRVCLGKFWMARMAGELVRPKGAGELGSFCGR